MTRIQSRSVGAGLRDGFSCPHGNHLQKSEARSGRSGLYWVGKFHFAASQCASSEHRSASCPRLYSRAQHRMAGRGRTRRKSGSHFHFCLLGIALPLLGSFPGTVFISNAGDNFRRSSSGLFRVRIARSYLGFAGDSGCHGGGLDFDASFSVEKTRTASPGVLAVIGSFLLFGVGTWFALVKSKWFGERQTEYSAQDTLENPPK